MGEPCVYGTRKNRLPSLDIELEYRGVVLKLKPADQVVPLFRDKNNPLLTDQTIISAPVKLHALDTTVLMVPDWIDAHEVPLLVDKYPNVLVPISILVASFERQMG